MRVDELAIALRQRDALRARVLYQELLLADPATIEPPQLTEPIELAIAASIAELIAQRMQAEPPAWTRDVCALQDAYVLVTVRLPAKLERLRRETPAPLRARNLVAPEDFLSSA